MFGLFVVFLGAGVHCFTVPSCVVRGLPWGRLKELNIYKKHLERTI